MHNDDLPFGMSQIADLPIKAREAAFAGAERCLHAARSELGVAGPQLDSIVDLQIKAIRQIVTDIDRQHRQAAAR
jgi:hypothetical protein